MSSPYSFYNPVSVIDTTDTTSSLSGSLMIPNGSISIGKSFYVGGLRKAPLFDTSTLAGWYNIGTVTGAAGSRATLKLIGSSGYNSNQTTGGETVIHLSINNNSDTTTVTNANAMYYNIGPSQGEAPALISLKLVQNGTNRYSYNLYANMNSYSMHSIHVNGDPRISFTPSLIPTTDPGANSVTVQNAASGLQLHSQLFLRNNVDTTTSSGGSLRIYGGIGMTGNIAMDGGKSVIFSATSLANPSFTTRSIGSRMILYPLIGASTTDYAFGVETGHIWQSCENNISTVGFKWYGGATQVARLDGTGQLFTAGQINVGVATAPTTTGKLSLIGPVSSLAGPHLSIFSSGDLVNPMYQHLMWNTDNMIIGFSSYYNGTNHISSSATSNFQISKGANSLSINTNSGTAIGSTISTYKVALSISGSGDVTHNGYYISSTLMGQNVPTFTTRSVGTRLVLYPSVDATNADWAYGLASNAMWASLGQGTASTFFRWYGGTTQILQMDGTGSILATNHIYTIRSVDSGTFMVNRNTSNTANAFAMVGAENSSGTGIYMFVNSATRTADGGANSGTLRNDVGDLCLQAASGTGLGIRISGTTNYVTVLTTTDSTTTTTGALQVKGGIGIVGSLFAGGSLNTRVSGTGSSNLMTLLQPSLGLGNLVSLLFGSALSTDNSGFINHTNNGANSTVNIGLYGSANYLTLGKTISTINGPLNVTGAAAINSTTTINVAGTTGTNLLKLNAGSMGTASEVNHRIAYGNSSFGANDISASIDFVRENSAANNATSIVFKTYNGAATNSDLAGEKMRISSGGNLTVTGNISGSTLTATNSPISMLHTLSNGFSQPFTFTKTNAGAAVGVGNELGFFSWSATNTALSVTRAAYVMCTVEAVGNPFVSGRLSFVTTGTTGAGEVERMRINGDGIVSIYNTTDSTTTTSGALQVSGGAGITKNLYVGGSLVVSPTSGCGVIDVKGPGDGTTYNLLHLWGASNKVWQINHRQEAGFINNLTFYYNDGTSWYRQVSVQPGGSMLIHSTTDSTTTTSGALLVAGGAGVSKNLYVGESLVAKRVIGASTSQAANDLLYIGPNRINAFIDREINGGKFIIGYNTPKGTTQSGILAIFNNATDRMNILEIFTAGTSSGTNSMVINVPLNINGTTDATSTTSGALQIVGGVGISKSLFVGNSYNLPSNQQYPPAAMTGDTTVLSGQPYGNGTYIASASSSLSGSWPAYAAFNYGTGSTDAWHDTGALYNPSTGVYTGSASTTVSSAAVLGEWIQLQLPSAITVKSIGIAPRTTYSFRLPRSFVLAGSNDGTTWTTVMSNSSIYYQNRDTFFWFTVNASTAYSYYRLIIREVNNGTDSVNIGEFRFLANTATNSAASEYNVSTSGSDVVLKNNLAGNVVVNAPLAKTFAYYPTSTWTSNASLIAGWTLLNSSNISTISWLPNNNGIQWKDTNIYIPVTGVYQLCIIVRVSSGAVEARYNINTSVLGNGATSAASNNTNVDAFVIGTSSLSAGIENTLQTVTTLNAGTILNAWIYCTAANTPTFLQISISLIDYLV